MIKGTFINNSNKTGVNLVANDFNTPVSNTTTLLTTITYTAGMYSTASIGDGIFPTVTVTSGLGGKALLTFSETAPANKQIAWKLYSSSQEQRIAVSKALKPKADL